jgi:hypothetical protein
MTATGVLCPDTAGDDSGKTTNMATSYVYDDHYVDCGLGDGSTIAFPLVPKSAEQVSHEYSCTNFHNCLGQECNITFADVTIAAEPARFADRCIFAKTSASNTTTNIAISAAPTPPPVLQRRQIVATFRLGFGMDYFPGNDGNNNPLTCQINRPDVTIRCTNGIIKFVQSTLVASPCAQPDDATLVCNNDATDSATLSLGDLHNITYVCILLTSPRRGPRCYFL